MTTNSRQVGPDARTVVPVRPIEREKEHTVLIELAEQYGLGRFS